jgi:hypothetical protein
MPLRINFETVAAVFKTEMISLQFHTDLRNTFQRIRPLDSYKPCLPADKFLVLSDHAWRMTSILGSTRGCEQFSLKNKAGEVI